MGPEHRCRNCSGAAPRAPQEGARDAELAAIHWEPKFTNIQSRVHKREDSYQPRTLLV